MAAGSPMAPRDAFSLSGKVVVVTGGAGLYGKPMSTALAEAGALVVLASRSQGGTGALAEALVARGLRAQAEVLDQGDEASVLKLRDRVLERHGSVNVLVNNAVARPMAGWEDPLGHWEESLRVNGAGLFAMCRAFLAPMMERGEGSIINIGSIQSSHAPDFGLYEGTAMTTPPDYHFHKHGMLGLTRYLAALGGPRGVRANMLSPGGLRDGSQPDAFVRRYSEKVALRRMAEPGDIAGPVVFLASDAARYITGTNLPVDGGYAL